MSPIEQSSNNHHHRATRSGYFFKFIRNLAIVTSGLGCLLIGLGLLGVILMFAHLLQIGVEGLEKGWNITWDKSFINILMPTISLIILGGLILIGGLIVNWIVSKPVYHGTQTKKTEHKE